VKTINNILLLYYVVVGMGKQDFKKSIMLLAIAALFTSGMTVVSVYADDHEDDEKHDNDKKQDDYKVYVCHDDGNLKIKESELDDHTDHGDDEGKCKKEKKIYVCHDDGNLKIKESELEDHKDHGDDEGKCKKEKKVKTFESECAKILDRKKLNLDGLFCQAIIAIQEQLDPFLLVQDDPNEPVLEIQVDPSSDGPAILVADGTDPLFTVKNDGSIQFGSNTVIFNPDGTVTGGPLHLLDGSTVDGLLLGPGLDGQDGAPGVDGLPGADGDDCSIDGTIVTCGDTSSDVQGPEGPPGTGGTLDNAKLDCNLIRASLDRAPQLDPSFNSCNLTGADLTDADLSYADLSGADFTGATLSGTDFNNANLAGATGTFIGCINHPLCTGAPTPSSNEPPVADAGGPYIGVAGTSLQFDGTATDPNTGDVLTFVWDFGDGSTSTILKPTHTYVDNVGSPFTVTLTVTDDGTPSLSDTATTTATITPPPPPSSITDTLSLISRDGFVRSDDQSGTDCNPDVETRPFFSDFGTTMSVEMFNTAFRHCNFSYVEWDTSGIPDTATITKTVIKFEVTSATAPRNCNYVDMGSTQPSVLPPSVINNQALLTAILFGSHYVTDVDDPLMPSTSCTSMGSKSIDLGPIANADLEAQLSSDYFAVGIEFDGTRDSVVHSISIATSEDTSATTKPTLEITYTP